MAKFEKTQGVSARRGISMRLRTPFCIFLLSSVCALTPHEAESVSLKVKGNVLVGVFDAISPMPRPQNPCPILRCNQCNGMDTPWPVCNDNRTPDARGCDAAPCVKEVCVPEQGGGCCGHCFPNSCPNCVVTCSICEFT